MIACFIIAIVSVGCLFWVIWEYEEKPWDEGLDLDEIEDLRRGVKYSEDD